eukprot:GDKJ01056107.1.p1 GENE.GDKJ01056107.1~~GDKJ01056107.1.p1  ORF type:complete len:618 (+),score=160.38 GDKJ01056107.1:188-1855(+)
MKSTAVTPHLHTSPHLTDSVKNTAHESTQSFIHTQIGNLVLSTSSARNVHSSPRSRKARLRARCFALRPEDLPSNRIKIFLLQTCLALFAAAIVACALSCIFMIANRVSLAVSAPLFVICVLLCPLCFAFCIACLIENGGIQLEFFVFKCTGWSGMQPTSTTQTLNSDSADKKQRRNSSSVSVQSCDKLASSNLSPKSPRRDAFSTRNSTSKMENTTQCMFESSQSCLQQPDLNVSSPVSVECRDSSNPSPNSKKRPSSVEKRSKRKAATLPQSCIEEGLQHPVPDDAKHAARSPPAPPVSSPIEGWVNSQRRIDIPINENHLNVQTLSDACGVALNNQINHPHIFESVRSPHSSPSTPLAPFAHFNQSSTYSHTVSQNHVQSLASAASQKAQLQKMLNMECSDVPALNKSPSLSCLVYQRDSKSQIDPTRSNSIHNISNKAPSTQLHQVEMGFSSSRANTSNRSNKNATRVVKQALRLAVELRDPKPQSLSVSNVDFPSKPSPEKHTEATTSTHLQLSEEVSACSAAAGVKNSEARQIEQLEEAWLDFGCSIEG